MDRLLEEFRKARLIAVDVDESVLTATEVCRQNEVHHVVVLTGDMLAGMICTCDLENAPIDAPVGSFMHPPVTLSLKHTFQDAVEVMNECGVGSILLLDEETPRGLVTRGDLLRSRPSKDLQDSLERCACCGSTSHLKVSPMGHALCLACRTTPRQRTSYLVPVKAFS